MLPPRFAWVAMSPDVRLHMPQPKYVEPYCFMSHHSTNVFHRKLVFSLSSAWEWKKQHAGFHFPALYNLIVDTFKDPEDKIAKGSVNELLQWWNRYV